MVWCSHCSPDTKVFQIDVSQYIQAHTILKTLAKTYADQPVLVLGGKANQVQQVAEEYDWFQSVDDNRL